MYLGDAEFVEFLKKLKPCLKSAAFVVIKENKADATSEEIVGTYLSESDRSLCRSETCFKHVFAKAGYNVFQCEDWNPIDGMNPIYTVAIQPSQAICDDEDSHVGCPGINFRYEW